MTPSALKDARPNPAPREGEAPTERGANKQPLCIWHGGCLDGFTSAWIVNRFFGGECEFYPGIYQETPPDVTGRNVLMVDFSYKKDVIEEMRKTARAILILDHHKTAMEDLKDYFVSADKVQAFPYFPKAGECAAFFDMQRSGAGLCWDFFFVGQPEPRFVQHVQDRDLWRFKMGGTREINALAYSHDFDFHHWDRLVSECETDIGWSALVDAGAAIDRQHRKNCLKLIENGKQTRRIGGIEMPVVNAPNFFASDIGNILSDTHDCKCGATYIDMADGKRAWSLRSIDGGPDVSEIARSMGGGGHAHAAGFSAPSDWSGDGDGK